MKSLEITDSDAKDKYSEGVIRHDRPKYPYGTKIYIGKEMMAKLEMSELPSVGATFMILASAKVVEASEENDEKKFELQLTDMAIKPDEKKKDSVDIAESIYS